MKVLEKPKSLKIKEFDVSVKNAKEEIRIPEKPPIEVLKIARPLDFTRL